MKNNQIIIISPPLSLPTKVKNIRNDRLQAAPRTLLWSHPHKGGGFGTFGRRSGDSDDFDDTHAGVHEVVLILVWVVQGLGEGEVVRSVEGVAGVQIEGDVATEAGVQLHQLGLEPGHGVGVSDVQQGGQRNVLILGVNVQTGCLI